MVPFLFVIIAILLVIIYFLRQKFATQKIKFLNDLEIQKKETEVAVERFKTLSKYEVIEDAEKWAEEIRKATNIDCEVSIKNANLEKEKAKNEANNLISEAQKEAKKSKETALNLISNTYQEAQKILDAANKQAEEIAGDAYLALQDSRSYTATVKAMKNIIEGYGDQYLRPTYSLLDDLAEEFGHTEAGEKLKYSREYTNKMVESDQAAKCDYVEQNRKETAKNFVLDAFNGKIDSILSKVKKDNYGTLEQKIKDAFVIVNSNGKAFRNAVITNEYLNARLEELKWAVITQELKWNEQEEQRRIKEQIRDEERARREYEKTMKDAQKEEELLQKMIEKARSEIETASDEQKLKYESRLLELEEKLKIAEEKNQRAISMAQQTRSGHVYVISNIGSFGENVYKIGMTRRLEPLDRVKELGDSSVPFEFDVHALIFSEDAPKLEHELHRQFMLTQLNKVNPRKEFFRVGVKQIKDKIENIGITAKWTMTAEARQYHETLLLEKSMLNDPKIKEEWERFQDKIDEKITIESEELSGQN